MDRLGNIIAFITVAETHSFAESARRLNLANSVVSKRIKDLESYLGTRLLQRTTRHVALTDAGYQYFDHARRLIHELAEVEENLRYQNENPVGDLRVSAPVSFGTKFLGPAVAAFLEKYPDVSVRLFLGDRAADLSEEDFDLAIRIGDIGNTALVARKLAESRRVTVASPAYLKAHGRPEKPQDLGRHNCLVYSGVNEGKAWSYRVKGRRVLQPVAGRFTSDNGMLLLDAALRACGITVLPSFIVGDRVNNGELEILLEDFEEEPMLIQAVYVPQRHLSARTRKFIDHLVQYFAAFTD
ncbi:MAG TPA: LysR family transcriptional regulator [Patescibacteria group bacterium]|nr:LysR family transcriptional regulator [Patescibacteria group bacterium]